MEIAASQELKKRIMRGVYRTWFWRSVAPMLASELLLLAGVLIGVLTHISVKHILENALSASGSLQAFVLFFINNFFVKSIQSRLLVLAFAALAFFFARDLKNTIGRLRQVSYTDLLASALVIGNRR